jgi:hypothetical protein
VAEQSSLGSRVVHRNPAFTGQVKIGRVTSIKDFRSFGRLDVIFLDNQQPAPVWVINELDREPVEGDFVLIGYIDGRKDMPYLSGFVKNKSWTTNFIDVRADRIRIQLPVLDFGTKDGRAHKDIQTNLLDEAKQKERAYLELTAEFAKINFPINGSNNPAYFKISDTGFEFWHPTGGAVFHCYQEQANAYTHTV